MAVVGHHGRSIVFWSSIDTALQTVDEESLAAKELIRGALFIERQFFIMGLDGAEW